MGDMSAVVWALVGLLAAALGILSTALFAAISRTDDLRDSMESKFDRVDGRFERIDERFQRVDERFDRLTEDIREVRDLLLSLHRHLTVAGA